MNSVGIPNLSRRLVRIWAVGPPEDSLQAWGLVVSQCCLCQGLLQSKPDPDNSSLQLPQGHQGPGSERSRNEPLQTSSSLFCCYMTLSSQGSRRAARRCRDRPMLLAPATRPAEVWGLVSAEELVVVQICAFCFFFLFRMRSPHDTNMWPHVELQIDNLLKLGNHFWPSV